jgi:ABC-2 type transport system permease protein
VSAGSRAEALPAATRRVAARVPSPARAVPTLVRRTLLDRRRALVGWSLSLGLLGALVMAIWPSVEDSVGAAVESYPESLKEAFGIAELSTPEQYLSAEMLALIVPIAVGIFALRAVAAALAGAEERGHLDVLLSAPVSRARLVTATFASTAIELTVVLAGAWALTMAGSALAGAGLSAGLAAAGFAMVWPLALLAAGVATLVTGVTSRQGVVAATASGALVAMYVVDLVGRLDDGLDWARYGSVFRYYGTAVEVGIDPLAFAGVTAVALGLAAAGALLFERRDLGA